MLKVEKKRRKLIKPEISTPENLKCYKISILDKLQFPFNEGIILFYESKSTDIGLLEESLSKILVRFYPLAGRYIKNSLSVDCSDEFIQAEALDVELMELVAKTETADQLNDLFPDQHFGVGRDIILNTFKNMGEAYRNSERNVIIFSDWSKFGFYDADFGWGKPVWTAIGKQRIGSNLTVLMRNKEGDGIEAWLYLDPHHMLCFQQDHHIKLFPKYLIKFSSICDQRNIN